MEKILDDMLIKSNGIIKDYVFCCSYDFKKDVNQYKGIPIYYFKLLPKNYIAYMYNPYFDNTKQ